MITAKKIGFIVFSILLIIVFLFLWMFIQKNFLQKEFVDLSNPGTCISASSQCNVCSKENNYFVCTEALCENEKFVCTKHSEK